MNYYSLLLYLLVLTACSRSREELPEPDPSPVAIEANILVENLKHPWEICWGPDDHIWMTERDGQLSRVDPLTGNKTTVFSIQDIVSRGEGGLLGLALHPEFEENRQLFLAWNYESSGKYLEKVVRFIYNNNTLTDPLVIIEGITAANIHNGCRLLVTEDDKIFITTGDAANPSSAPDIHSNNGKVLRLNTDGTVPSDNPYPDNPLWTFGHRNAQGLVWVEDRLYSSEHGPDTDDELNLIEKGKNYGWPAVRGKCDEPAEQAHCNDNTDPLYIWTPTIAVSGMDYYNADHIPQWKNSLLIATLKASMLVQAKLNADQSIVSEVNNFLKGEYGRLRDICISPAGKVYICTSNGSNDKIIEIQRKQE